MMARIAADVARSFPPSDVNYFSPLWALIVTWDGVTFDGGFTNTVYFHFICLAARKLARIQMYTKVYGYKIKNALYEISNYEERMAEKSFESD
jgi:hypothetical protein